MPTSPLACAGRLLFFHGEFAGTAQAVVGGAILELR